MVIFNSYVTNYQRVASNVSLNEHGWEIPIVLSGMEASKSIEVWGVSQGANYQRLFRNIPSLVNVNKKRWKIIMFNGKKTTISMASDSSSQTVTVITRWYYKCRVGEIQSKYDQEQQKPNIPIRSPTKGCDSQQLEGIISCLWVIHPIELYIRQYPP